MVTIYLYITDDIPKPCRRRFTNSVKHWQTSKREYRRMDNNNAATKSGESTQHISPHNSKSPIEQPSLNHPRIFTDDENEYLGMPSLLHCTDGDSDSNSDDEEIYTKKRSPITTTSGPTKLIPRRINPQIKN